MRYIKFSSCGIMQCESPSIPRLKAVKTAEELSDVFAQFSLYYGRDLVDMQHLKAMQKRQGDNEDQVQ